MLFNTVYLTPSVLWMKAASVGHALQVRVTSTVQ